MTAGGAALGLAQARPAAAAPTVPAPGAKWRGVNLGGWLVLEKWMTPSLYAGHDDALDEYSLSAAWGGEAEARLKAHRDTFITEADFKWIAGCGLNVVRIPVGYWVLEGDKPFVGAAAKLDWAFQQARKVGLSVLLDLHGAPGSQNGWDHSGRQGALQWHTSKDNIARTVRVIGDLAQRYKSYNNLVGIELLNEPRWDVPLDILKDYYQQAYRAARRHVKSSVAIVIHDGFRPFEWAGFMQEPEYANVLLDTHLYQCYTEEDRKRSASEQIQRAAIDRRKELERAKRQLPTIVGEWSIALDPQSLQGETGFARDVARRAFGDAQLLSYETTNGWIYWTYKLESSSDWNFRDSVERGLLPAHYGKSV